MFKKQFAVLILGAASRVAL